MLKKKFKIQQFILTINDSNPILTIRDNDPRNNRTCFPFDNEFFATNANNDWDDDLINIQNFPPVVSIKIETTRQPGNERDDDLVKIQNFPNVVSINTETTRESGPMKIPPTLSKKQSISIKTETTREPKNDWDGNLIKIENLPRVISRKNKTTRESNSDCDNDMDRIQNFPRVVSINTGRTRQFGPTKICPISSKKQ